MSHRNARLTVHGRRLIVHRVNHIHSVVDDHSRLPYGEILDDERADTCAAFVARTLDYFAAHGITRVELRFAPSGGRMSTHSRGPSSTASVGRRLERAHGCKAVVEAESTCTADGSASALPFVARQPSEQD